MVASPSLLMTSLPWMGRAQGHVTHFRIFHPLKSIGDSWPSKFLYLCDVATVVIGVGYGPFFGGGWIDFARKIWGSARKMNSRTNMIKQDETRKLDYIDCGKSLKNYIYIYIVLLSSIFVKHALNSHFRCPKNCSIARKKIIMPDSGGGLQPSQPSSSYAYVCDR